MLFRSQSYLTSAILWTVAWQAALSMEFSRQEYWSGLPLSSPGDLPEPGINLVSPALQANSLLSEPPGKPKVLVAQLCPTLCDPMDCSLPGSSVHASGKNTGVGCRFLLQGIFPTQGSNTCLLHCDQFFTICYI